MTVWAKLQSWLGASASDVAIDNEFNNIYLGLNEAANGNLPSGYNKVDLTFTGASLTIKGETKIGNINVALDSTLTVSGAAGWRYIVTTNGGVMSVESIPPAEITADTQVYTPTPVFNTSANGYYSTVNTARRIVGICYFDATDIKEVIAYGTGKTKNDNIYASYSSGTNPAAADVGYRLQYTKAFNKARGEAISIVDGGEGTANGNGVQITANKNCKITIMATLALGVDSGTIDIALDKNWTPIFPNIASNAQISSAGSMIIPVNISDIAKSGDVYTFVVSASSGITAAILGNLIVLAEEL